MNVLLWAQEAYDLYQKAKNAKKEIDAVIAAIRDFDDLFQCDYAKIGSGVTVVKKTFTIDPWKFKKGGFGKVGDKR